MKRGWGRFLAYLYENPGIFQGFKKRAFETKR